MNETSVERTVPQSIGVFNVASPSSLGPMDEANSPASATPRAPAASDVERFRAIVEAHFNFIWRSLRGFGVPAHSVDDAAQHVFLVASQKLESIGVGSERAFLFGTALGVAANVRRAHARNREVFDEVALETAPDGLPNADTLIELKEQRAVLDEVLETMPDDLRTVFVLFVLEGMRGPEIAGLLGVATGTVASRLRRARESFHEITKRLEARKPMRNVRGSL